jgi:hypothetical protein
MEPTPPTNEAADRIARARASLEAICRLTEGEATYQTVLRHCYFVAICLDDLKTLKDGSKIREPYAKRKPFSIWNLFNPNR